MPDLAAYSFDKVSCIVGGVPILDYMDGNDVVRIQRPADQITPLVGADGKAIVSVNLNESAIIELKLKPSSASNAYLAALLLAFQKALVANPFPVLVTSLQNGEGWAGSEAIVMARPPDVGYGKEATQRLWKVFVHNLQSASIGVV